MNDTDLLQFAGTIGVFGIGAVVLIVDRYGLFRQLAQRCIAGWVFFVGVMRLAAQFGLVTQLEGRIINGIAALVDLSILLVMLYLAVAVCGRPAPNGGAGR